MKTPEHKRLEEIRKGTAAWRHFGPYLSERQWGTVREDYSAHGTAWDYLPHDHARSRAYRWGEDGIAGFSDVQQLLCLGLVRSSRSGSSASQGPRGTTERTSRKSITTSTRRLRIPTCARSTSSRC